MTQDAGTPEGLRARYAVQLKLRNADTDQFRHVNNAAIATFFEEARMAVFMQDALVDSMKDRHVVVAHLAIDFIAEVMYPGELDVGTMPVRTGNTSFELAQALYANGKLCARASATCVLMDAKTGRPAPLPAVFRERLAPTRPVACAGESR